VSFLSFGQYKLGGVLKMLLDEVGVVLTITNLDICEHPLSGRGGGRQEE
jgi:hypothetical protein